MNSKTGTNNGYRHNLDHFAKWATIIGLPVAIIGVIVSGNNKSDSASNTISKPTSRASMTATSVVPPNNPSAVTSTPRSFQDAEHRYEAAKTLLRQHKAEAAKSELREVLAVMPTSVAVLRDYTIACEITRDGDVYTPANPSVNNTKDFLNGLERLYSVTQGQSRYSKLRTEAGNTIPQLKQLLQQQEEN